jgi:hypothetical protein
MPPFKGSTKVITNSEIKITNLKLDVDVVTAYMLGTETKCYQTQLENRYLPIKLLFANTNI